MAERRGDRLEAAIQRLAEAQTQTQIELRQLAEAQARTERRLEELVLRVDALAEAQVRTERRLEELVLRVDALAEAQARTQHQLDELAVRVSRLADRVGTLVGRIVEADYREKAHAYFSRLVLGIRTVPRDDLSSLAADAERGGILSTDEHDDLLQADVVIRGRLRDRQTDGYLLAEVSATVEIGDVQRAMRRARLLERILGVPVLAAVAGERITPEADREADVSGVWRVLDGRAHPPMSPATPAS